VRRETVGIWFRKTRKVITSTAGRITGISTPIGGFQLAPASKFDTSFSRAQDERQLMDEIWLLAGSEAYGAKDGERRLQEMSVQSRIQVIDGYLAMNPEIKRWVDRNVEAGTCAAAVAELREKKERLRQSRLAPPRPERDPAFEWMRQLSRRPASL
jgi:hypothetical protein